MVRGVFLSSTSGSTLLYIELEGKQIFLFLSFCIINIIYIVADGDDDDDDDDDDVGPATRGILMLRKPPPLPDDDAFGYTFA